MKDISLHILDIAQNSISAKASVIAINITDSINQNIYSVEIIDNGKGIPSEMMPTITDPWTTSRITRKVGLGIPLFKQNAELTGGHFSIESDRITSYNVCYTKLLRVKMLLLLLIVI